MYSHHLQGTMMYMNVLNQVVIEPSWQLVVNVVIFNVNIKVEHILENPVSMVVANRTPSLLIIPFNFMKELVNGTQTGKLCYILSFYTNLSEISKVNF